ncbi:DUF1178 family protein [Terrihabitans sp. B22-R8]|uniref:DUF1178 family protein n=1 Tax=Terrihabitans sp. B22-R8 TaxID=3425128 RepID=UPI00403C415D
MIHYALRCVNEHGFDGWFRGSEDFEKQAASGFLSCPVCGSNGVSKALMAPSVRTADASADPVPMSADAAPVQEMALLGEKEQRLRAALLHLRQEVTKNAQNVGPRFAEIARQMHEGEIEKASIYGRASAEEARALVEEGIEFHPLPAVADEVN